MKALVKILSTVVVLWSSSAALAGGPIYSRFGLGDLRLFGSNRASAMGLLGLGLSGDGFINRFNPAGLSKISLTRISGGFVFDRTTSTDQLGSTTLARGDFQSLALAIPASTADGLVLFAGASPYSLVNYNLKVNGNTPGIPSTQTLVGQGGISSLSIGASYSPVSDVSFGLKYSYLYGTISRISNITFDDPSFTQSETDQSLYHAGSMVTFGFQADSIGRLLNAPGLLPFSFGFVLTSPVNLSVKEETILLTPSAADTTVIARGKTSIPIGYGFGLSYAASSRLLVAGDVFLQPWTSANFFGIPPVSTRNSVRAAVGMEFAARQNPETYWERVAYRAGFTYTTSYVAFNGQALNEWYVSGGLALPIGPDARINLALHLGSRGSTVQGLQKDNFLRVAVSFSASERWFITIEED